MYKSFVVNIVTTNNQPAKEVPLGRGRQCGQMLFEFTQGGCTLHCPSKMIFSDGHLFCLDE